MSDSIRQYWVDALRQLADDPNEFDDQGGDVVFVRRGKVETLSMRDRPGVGLAVKREINGVTDFVPIEVFIQRDLLELPRLALQIQKTLDRLASKRVARYIDGPARFEVDGKTSDLDRSIDNLKQVLCETEPGVTNLIQLMAPAGHGKTVLLEELAQHFSRTYTSEVHPFPIILLVDLLGRFVGNIDDAIAGAINNTYSFPSLTQRDVVVAMRNRWLTLALDGFDELVARIGPKDAFLRISDLLDQVGGAGSIVISARESFFELHRISIAIRSYLQPKRGSFKTSIVRLIPWSEQQGIEVFRQLGSTSPQQDLNELRRSFADDWLAFQPFFLTRLAELWQKGERFSSGGVSSQLSRVKYVIERLLEREALEKWRDSKGTPILSTEEHELVLCTVAEEMFRTGAFFLRVDETRLAAQFALEELKKPKAIITDAVERFPTHAFLQSTERGYRFSHDKFLHYFLGTRLAWLCVNEPQDFLTCIKTKEISSDITEWLRYSLPKADEDRLRICQVVLAKIGDEKSAELRINVGAILPALLKNIDCKQQVHFVGALFSGEGLKEICLKNVLFSKCTFSSVDLSGSNFEVCVFSDCDFDSMAISETTAFPKSIFSNPKIGALQLQDKEKTFYSPKEINERISLLGGQISQGELIKEQVLADEIPAEVVETVERLIKASHKGWDICVEEFVERWGDTGSKIVQEGLRWGLLREWNRDTGGPRRHFVRFQVDRNSLLSALKNPPTSDTLTKFWRSLI